MPAPFPVHQLEASDPFERGRQHGALARAQVAVSVETYRSLFRDFVGIDWEEAKAIGSRYADSIAAFDPRLLEEIHGVAAGSGFEEAEILALNARSEIALNDRTADGCTAFAAYGRATRARETILCQNWDWRSSQREAFVVLEFRPEGKPAVTMLTEAGIIGKLGFNDRGLGVCLNAIVTDEVSESGTPLHIVLRGILESRNLGEAVETVYRTPIASAANFLVAQHGVGALDIEATPSRVDVLVPEDDVLVHTNHLLSLRLATVRDLAGQVLPDSYPRLARAHHLIAEVHGQIDVGAAQAILRDHANEPDGICRHEDEIGDPEGKRLESVFSLVMSLDGPECWLTDGPPCTTDYEALEASAMKAVAS